MCSQISQTSAMRHPVNSFLAPWDFISPRSSPLIFPPPSRSQLSQSCPPPPQKTLSTFSNTPSQELLFLSGSTVAGALCLEPCPNTKRLLPAKPRPQRAWQRALPLSVFRATGRSTGPFLLSPKLDNPPKLKWMPRLSGLASFPNLPPPRQNPHQPIPPPNLLMTVLFPATTALPTTTRRCRRSLQCQDQNLATEPHVGTWMGTTSKTS